MPLLQILPNPSGNAIQYSRFPDSGPLSGFEDPGPGDA